MTDRPRAVVVSTLGTAQILAWGMSYYLTAVLATPITADTGWSMGWVVGAFSIGLLVSGLVSPRVGHLIDRHGGRPVLAASAVLMAVGLGILAAAPVLAAYVIGWLVLGLAMGMGLYDPAFSTLGRIYGDQARMAITMVTLFGGFASTVCWPLSAVLVEQVGWRGTCLSYAAMALVLLLPLYWFGLPQEPRRAAVPPTTGGHVHGRVRREQRVAFVLVASGFAVAALIMTIVAVTLLPLLQAQGQTLAAAVAFGTLIGPSQVGGRILEMLAGKNRHPIWSLIASTLLVAIGLVMLIGAPTLIAIGIVLYGSGSGIRSIVRGTVPLALFGKEGYAILMGKIAMPTLIVQAASPSIGAFLLEEFGPEGTLLALCGAAALNIALALALVPLSLPRQQRGATSN